jgi:hypothetical protein
LDAQPKQRFEALKAFITVPGIEKSEESLREAWRTADVNYNEAVRRDERTVRFGDCRDNRQARR